MDDLKSDKVSLLTTLLEQSKLNNTNDDSRGNNTNYDEEDQLSLTIYLPNCDSITVLVPESSIVQDVIRQTLLSHHKQKLSPPLEYAKPYMYELRIHEGTDWLFLNPRLYITMIMAFSLAFNHFQVMASQIGTSQHLS